MLPGPRTSFTLQELSTTVGDRMDVTKSWITVGTFSGIFQSVVRDERLLDAKDTALGRYILFIAGDILSEAEVEKLIEPNRVQIALKNYNIIGVEPYETPWGGINHYQVYLRLIE